MVSISSVGNSSRKNVRSFQFVLEPKNDVKASHRLPGFDVHHLVNSFYDARRYHLLIIARGDSDQLPSELLERGAREQLAG